MLLAIHCKTKNDANGNPRRGWLILDPDDNGRTVAFAVEGYLGQGALRAAGYRWASDSYVEGRTPIADGGSLEITPGQYRALARAEFAVRS